MNLYNYVDRGALAQARLNNLDRDLHMVGEYFNTAVSILTVGYVLMQLPSNMLLTRVRPSLYLTICMIIWSTVSGMPDSLSTPYFPYKRSRLTHTATCTGLVNSYTSLVGCRFLLGKNETPKRQEKKIVEPTTSEGTE